MTYKILADNDIAVVLDETGSAYATFKPRDGYSAFTLAERCAATKTRASLAHSAIAYHGKHSVTNIANVPNEYGTKIAHESLNNLKAIRILLDKAISAGEDECDTYDRTTQGAER